MDLGDSKVDESEGIEDVSNRKRDEKLQSIVEKYTEQNRSTPLIDTHRKKVTKRKIIKKGSLLNREFV